MANPGILLNRSSDGSSEYGFAALESKDLEDSWENVSKSRSRTASNSTPNPVQKVNNWIKNNKTNGSESSNLQNDDFMFFRYDSEKSEQQPDEDLNCDPGFYDLPTQPSKTPQNKPLFEKVDVKLLEEPLRKTGKPKGRRKSEGMPCFTKTVLESDATSIDVPLSPESEQKRELCSYLQLMKPSDKKQVILLQNRRSTRVKNLYLLQERKELEKKLREEELESHTNGHDDSEKYLGLKSFKELNIKLDKTWLSSENAQKTWLKCKQTEFEFPKPPSDFEKTFNDFENTNFSWIRNSEKQLENGSPLPDVERATPKISKVKEKLKDIKEKSLPCKGNLSTANGSHMEKFARKSESNQCKTPKQLSKQRISESQITKTSKKNSCDAVNISKPRKSNENVDLSVEKLTKKVKNHKLLVVPKPLSILKDLTVDFDVVMEKKIEMLKKTEKRNGKLHKIKRKLEKKGKHRNKDRNHKLDVKHKKVMPRSMIKIKLFSAKPKKRKLISDIMDSLNSGPPLKKPNTIKDKKVSKEIKGNKDAVKRIKEREDNKKRKNEKKIVPKETKENHLVQRETHEVLKENKKPESNKEKRLSHKVIIDKESPQESQKPFQKHQKLFAKLFTDLPRVTGLNYEISPTPETSDFIDEQQFSLLSEEHQRILMQSRIPIMPELDQLKFGKNMINRYRSRSVSPIIEFIQDFSDIPLRKPMDRVFKKSDNQDDMSDDSKSDISEGELQGFASDEQDFPGFDLPIESAKERMSITLHLSPEPSEKSDEPSGTSSKESVEIRLPISTVNKPLQEKFEMSRKCEEPLRIEIDDKAQDQRSIVPFKKTGEANSLARSLISPRRHQGFKTNFEVLHSPQSWVPDSPSQKQKRNQHSIFISPENGSIIKAFYIEYNLVLCQELAVSFWTQTALGSILGAQNMWIPKGNIQRLVMDNKCIFKESSEMVVSTETNVAYVELWMKEHESDLRQRPVADVFATIYFWKKGQKGIEKKVLQLENINGFADDVQYSVLKYTSKIIVSWHTAGNQLECRATNVHCYDLAVDYQTVSNVSEFESVEHYVSSLHNVQDCDGLVMGCGENKMTLWNVEYGYVVATVTMTDIPAPLSTLWVKCDRGFLFTLQQCADRELRMIAIKGMDGSWKKLASYVPPEEYDRLKGACVENGLVLAIFDQGIHCWNAKTGESVVEECQSETGHISGKYVITVVNDQVIVRHAVTHLLSSEDL